jgi:hypothetical protein
MNKPENITFPDVPMGLDAYHELPYSKRKSVLPPGRPEHVYAGCTVSREEAEAGWTICRHAGGAWYITSDGRTLRLLHTVDPDRARNMGGLISGPAVMWVCDYTGTTWDDRPTLVWQSEDLG